jgi:CheY-like chemotaxis protein
VHVAGTGREALESLRRQEYDIVLMDIQMPEMDGFEATHAIRALGGRHATLPIIALTAHALSGERDRCLAQGMTDYLAKPFKAHELFGMVERDYGDTPAPAPASAPAAQAGTVVGQPPVDLEGFRSMLREAGAEGALYSILDTFLRQAPERLAALATAVAGGTAPDVARAAHVFRGAAATIGATELAGLLEQTETAARAERMEVARDAFERVGPLAREVIDYLRTERAAMPEE